jgi:AcrR family transcriptional regulator
MARISKNPDERRNELLDAALELFSKKSYQYTTISDIVKKVGVSQGTFYYYFKSKEEIADELIDRPLTNVQLILEKFVNAPNFTPLHKMTGLIAYNLYDFDCENGFGDISSFLNHENNAFLHQKLAVLMIRKFSPMLANIVEEGILEGTFRTKVNPPLLAEFLFTGYQFWLHNPAFCWSEEERKLRIAAIGVMTETLLGAEEGSFGLANLEMAKKTVPLSI